MKQHSIWKDTMFWTAEETKDVRNLTRLDLKANNPDTEYSDSDIDEIIERENEHDYEFTWEDFKTFKTNNIICIADNATWRGRRTGVKLCGHGLDKVLHAHMDGSISVYYDRFNIRAEEVHHDTRFCNDPSPNKYLYREVKDEYSYMSDYELCNLLVQDGEINKRNVTKYTKTLKPYLQQLWGVK